MLSIRVFRPPADKVECHMAIQPRCAGICPPVRGRRHSERYVMFRLEYVVAQLGGMLLSAGLLGGCPGAANGDGAGNGEVPDEPQSEAEINADPIASAGDDQTVTSGSLVVLNGVATTDANGDRLQFFWGQIGGAPSVTLEDGFSSAPRFFAPDVPATAVLTFRLTVGDGRAISTDDVAITITP